MRTLMLRVLLISLTLVTQGCLNSGNEEATAPAIEIVKNQIKVKPDSEFLGQLSVVPVKAAPGGERKLSTVGQMIALANSSGALTKDETSWVTLDPELARSLGLHLSSNASIGLAYGVTNINQAYRDDVQPGEKVLIYRYGLKKNSTIGSILSIKKVSNSDDQYSVLFSVGHGQEWYPGTNCQVEFPLIQRQSVAISPLSMLHEGKREFVMKEISSGVYEAVEITVLNETRDQVFALGNLKLGDRIVERGAILLKPTIHEVLVESNEVSGVR